MASNEFEIRVKIAPGVDDARLQASLSIIDRTIDRALDAAASKPITLPPIQVPPIQVPPIDIPPISIPPIDLPPVKGIDQLAAEFDDATAEAKKLEAQQRSALAALILAGEEGSDQYVDLVAGIMDARKQSEELADAQKRVSAMFDEAPRTPAPVSTGVTANSAFQFNQMQEAAERVADAMAKLNAPAIEFESSLAAVGAITGQSGAALDALGERARQLALDFGGSATSQLASFQGILSKLGPQVADDGEALGKLATNVNILSQASGDDAATSMSAIVDSMLQFGLVTGDAAKDAETSTRVINALAASAQVGAAEIPQVAEAILQAGVAAKGANMSFESTNAALQVLAVGGKTGSEAGVALRNVLGLIQNASGPAATAMGKIGTSSAELGELLTTKGLDVAMAKIRDGMNGLGTDAERNAVLMQIFGTENASAAGILMDNLGSFKQFEEGIAAGQQGMGAAFEQAAIRMDTSQSAISRAKAAVEDTFISISQTLGGTITTVTSSFAEILPSIQGLAGLKQILPEGMFSGVAQSLKGILLPAMESLGIVRKVNAAAAIGEAVAEGASAVAKTTEAAATGAATTAQYALNTAMLASPIFWIGAAVVGVVAAFALWGDSTKDLKEATEDANKALEEFQKSDAAARAAEKQAKDLDKLASEYERLQGRTDAASQKRFGEVSSELAKQMPEAAIAVENFAKAGEKAGQTYDVNTKLVRMFADEQRRMADDAKQSALANLDDQAQALTVSYTEAIEAQKSLRALKADAQDAVVDNEGKAISVAYDSAKNVLGEVNEKLAENRKKLEEARPQIEKLVDGYQEMGLSAAEIAKRTGMTIEMLKEFRGELDGTLITSNDLEKAIGKLPEDQQRALRTTTLHAEEFKKAQNEVDGLNARLAAAKFGGDVELTKKLEKDLADAQKTADEKKVKLQTDLDDEDTQKALKALPEDAQKLMRPVMQTIDVVVSDKSLADTQEKAGGILKDIAELQKSQSEAQGDGAKAAYDDKILAKQLEFRKNLEIQATTIATNEQNLQALRAAKERASDPKEVARLNGEIATLERKTDDASKQFNNAANAGKRMGVVQGDVKNVAAEFGFTGKAADGAATATNRIAAEAVKAASGAAKMAEEFQKARADANSALASAKGELVGLRAQMEAAASQGDAARAADLKAQYDKRLAEAKAAARGLIDGDKIIRQVESDIGVTSLADQERREKERRDKAARAAEERRKQLSDAQQQALKNFEDGEKAQIDLIDDGYAKERALAELHVEVVRRTNALLQAADDADKKLNAQQRAERAKARQIDQQEADQALREVTLKAQAEFSADVLKADDDLFKSRTELLKAQTDALAEIDAASIEERGRMVIDGMRRSRDQEINEKVRGSEVFAKYAQENAKTESQAVLDAQVVVGDAQKALRVKQQELDKQVTEGSISSADAQAQLRPFTDAYASATEQLTTQQTALTERLGELRQLFITQLGADPSMAPQLAAEISAALLQANTAIDKTTSETQTRVRSARSREEIARIKSVTEQEKQLKLLAIQEQLDKDLDANRLNETKKTELVRQAAIQRSKIEEDYQRQNSAAWEAAYSGLSAFVKGMFSEIDAEQRKALAKQKNDLDQQMADLKLSLLKHTMSIDEYDSKVRGLLDQQSELQKKLGDEATTLWERIADGAKAAFDSLEKTMSTRLDTSLASLNDQITSSLDIVAERLNLTAGSFGDKLSSLGEMTESELEAITDALVKVGEDTAGVLLSVWGQMAATGKATLGDFADAAIVTAIRSIRTIVEGNIVAIIAAAFALNPLIGILSIPAVLAIEVMLATWEADAQGRLGEHGFRQGGYTGDGSPDEVAGVAHRREFYFPEPITSAWRPEFEKILAGNDPRQVFGIPELSAWSVDMDGRLQSTVQVVHELAARQDQHALAIGGMMQGFRDSQAMLRQAYAEQSENFGVVEEVRASGRNTVAAIGELRGEIRELRGAVVDRVDKLGRFQSRAKELELEEARRTNRLLGTAPGDRDASLASVLANVASLLEDIKREVR